MHHAVMPALAQCGCARLQETGDQPQALAALDTTPNDVMREIAQRRLSSFLVSYRLSRPGDRVRLADARLAGWTQGSSWTLSSMPV
jgi:hypothetical protein